MNSTHITLKGVRRKINTKISVDRLNDIKTASTNFKKGNFLNNYLTVFHGGIKDSRGKNISKQFKRVEALHNSRLNFKPSIKGSKIK